ncbi:MAG: hypothetical protein Wins2KO_31700 [Winogradskyella sp.]
MNMVKGLINSILVLIIYYLLYFGFERLLEYLLLRGFFDNIDPDYILFVSPLINIFFILILMWFLRKKKNTCDKRIILNFKSVFIVCVFTITFFVIKEPFMRLDLILGNIEIPPIINKKQRSIIDLTTSFINIIILVPIFEELLFRKIVLNFFSKNHILIAIISSSIAFALIHLKFNDIDIIELVILFCFGITACLIYLRFGFGYNVLFHILSNSIWFFIDTSRVEYWGILRKLNFGIIYWVIIIICMSIFFYLCSVLFNKVSEINKNNLKR